MARFMRRLELFDAHGMSDSLRRSLNQVILGVTIYMVCNVVVTGASWTGFQREVLKADDFQLGLIAAIPVAANILQIFISIYMERKRNRRFLFLFFGILGRALWIVIGLLPYFIPASAQTLRVLTVIALVGLISTGNCFVNLSFASLMGDLVPMRIRGAYFGTRQRVSLISSVIAGLIVSYIVDSMGQVGYSIVLVVAGVAGCLDLCCFFRVDWPPMAEKSREELSQKPLRLIGEVFRDKTYMRFVWTFTLWAFVMNVPAPFFNVFMLEQLHMSYTTITLSNQIVSNLVTVAVVARWGKLLDRFGNRPIVLFSCSFVAFVPLLWIFMQPGMVWLAVVSNVLSGLFAPPYDLAQMNLYLGFSPQKNRSIYVAVFFIIFNLLGIALGNAVGGWLMRDVLSYADGAGFVLLGVTMDRYRCMFLMSAVLRVLVLVLVLPRLREQGASSLKEMGDTLRAERRARPALRRRR